MLRRPFHFPSLLRAGDKAAPILVTSTLPENQDTA